jgi:hypothetical protein
LISIPTGVGWNKIVKTRFQEGTCIAKHLIGDILRTGMLWDRIFILNFAYISRRFPADPGFFPLKRKNIYTATLLIADWNIHIS